MSNSMDFKPIAINTGLSAFLGYMNDDIGLGKGAVFGASEATVSLLGNKVVQGFLNSVSGTDSIYKTIFRELLKGLVVVPLSQKAARKFTAWVSGKEMEAKAVDAFNLQVFIANILSDFVVAFRGCLVKK